MSRARPEYEILNAALEAACRSSWEAGMHTLSCRDQFLLNEQWSQSYVGLAFNDVLRRCYGNKEAAYVTFETCVSWLEDFAGQERGPGRPPGRLRKGQRFDIVVWSKGWKVAGLVEIKDQPVVESYAHTADPTKLCGALRRWPSIRWGMFLFSVRSSGGRKYPSIQAELEAKSGKVFTAIEKALPRMVRAKRTRLVEGRGSRLLWCGAIFRKPA
ncbi:MAG TPA: hypothetical protein VF782_07395 [Allosphingosinicella sp.]